MFQDKRNVKRQTVTYIMAIWYFTIALYPIAFQDMEKDEVIYSSARNTKVIFLISFF